ncbi:MAG: N-acetylneuraminate synthase family protein, partial [Desulfovibrionaceae bacterium]
VIAEVGINHNGEFDKAVRMIEDAAAAGCECLKLQCHVVSDEMVYNEVVPGNASESIWNMMNRCSLDEVQERELMQLVRDKGMIFLSTPFSRAAADRLEAMGVCAYKIGSGECNNLPLIEHIAGFGKPVLLSTGMNDLESVSRSVEVLEASGVEYALFHCTSMYPTPYDKVRLGAMVELMERFPSVPVGLSDHSLGNYTCFGATALGASLLEKHFTSDLSWPGSDIPISITPEGLKDLIVGSRAIFEASGGSKQVLEEEGPCIAFAYSCVVAIKDICEGDELGPDNIWVKRPGTGEIRAAEYKSLFGRRATRPIAHDEQLGWEDIES